MNCLLFVLLVSITSKVVSVPVDLLCKSIDSRLPCSTRKLTSNFSQGSGLGRDIGAATADDIKSFFKSDDSCLVFQDLYETSDTFRVFVEAYMNKHRATFPVEHAELESMSDAAGIPVISSFIQNACAELGLMYGDFPDVVAQPQLLNDPPMDAPYLGSVGNINDAKVHLKRKVPTATKSTERPAVVREHCSDLGLITSENEIIQGHNEDWWSTVADKMSLLSTPDFFAYIYPGQLSGTSVVINRHGLSFTMNSLYPSVPGYTANSIPKKQGVAYVFAYVLRAVLNATTTEEAIHLLQRYPIYSGYSLNIMSACAKSVTNIEGYGDRLGIQSHLGDNSNMAGSVLGHYNLYINSAVEQDTSGSTAVERKQCQEKTTFNSARDVRGFLGNLTCPMFFTSINGLGESETLATWIIEPSHSRYSMYRMPVDCDIRQSKCYQQDNSYTSPQVFDWEYTCK